MSDFYPLNIYLFIYFFTYSYLTLKQLPNTVKHYIIFINDLLKKALYIISNMFEEYGSVKLHFSIMLWQINSY